MSALINGLIRRAAPQAAGNLKSIYIMKFILRIYDYIFYRVYIFFQKRNGDLSDENATNLVATLQCFLLINLFMIVRLIFDFEINKQYYNKWAWGLLFAIIIGVYNHMRYRKRFKRDNYSEFHSWWQDEVESKKSRNGLLIIAYMIFSIIVLPVLYTIIR